MKRILNQIFLILACIAFYATASAKEVNIVIDDIRYICNTEDGTAYVTRVNDYIVYTEVAEIKSAIEYDGKEYLVTKIGDSAFAGASYLTSVTIPTSVTEIGERAFYYCRSLESITLPCSVTEIGEKAFYSCEALVSLVIPNSVTKLGSMAFYGCSKLQSINIPNSVTEIGERAFYECSSLTEVYFEAENCIIYPFEERDSWNNTSVFYGPFPETLKSVVIGDEVESIPAYSFSGCRQLTDVTISNSVVAIGKDAFLGCKTMTEVHTPSLENWMKIEFENSDANPICYAKKLFVSDGEVRRLTIPEGVTSINSYAFYNCESLLTVTVPASVNNVGNEVFSGCANLQRITFPSFESYLSVNYLSGKSGLTYENKSKIYINSELLDKTQVVIPSTMTRIPDYAFNNWNELNSVAIPSTITEIGKGAFFECKNLSSVSLPNSIATINDSTFYGCSNLSTVTLPTSLTEIKDKVFYGCGNLGTITFPSSLSAIGNGAFFECKNLRSVSLPNSITTINDSTFYGCWRLRTITFPSSLIEIGNYAFYYCSDLTIPTFPSSLTTIGDYAFCGVWGTTELTFPSSLTAIGEYAFFKCGITALNFPASLKTIGYNAFHNCQNVKVIDISNANDWAKIKFGGYGPSLFDNPEAKLYVNGVEVKHLDLDLGDVAVSDYAFYGAKQLESVRIKGKGIGKSSFSSCTGLKNICIECDEVDYRAFWRCEAVENLYVPCDTPPVALDDSFAKYDGVNLYVPAGCVSAYENAEACWWKFLDVYESDFSNLDEIFKADYVNSDSGVEEIFFDNSANMKRPNDIYNLQGVCLKRNATSEDIKALQPGLYIIGGKKIVVK